MAINPQDLPTEPSAECHAEMLALAHAGDWAEFFALCPDSGNPDGAEGLRACLLLWARMRQDLGLPTGIPN
jgi:hypothetical protein